ncbi:MAG: TauD/TfdA family dioxygenase [Acidimicrobiales bacterium]
MAEQLVPKKDPSAYLGATRRSLLGGLLVGPATHLAADRERLAALTWTNFEVLQVGSTLGAELSGIDLREDLSSAVVADLQRALDHYKVIFFRDQPLSSEQHVAFAQRFGMLEVHPFIPSNTGIPELVRFEKTAEVAGYENSWHHDVTWRATPSMGAILHGIEVPPVGGDTLFSDMGAAYDGLPDEVKDKIEGCTAQHDYMKSFGHAVPKDRREETRQMFPMVDHPVAITHERTGRKLLYVNRNFVNKINDLPDDDAATLLGYLCDQAATCEYQIRFSWKKDSIAFWDNRSVQHYASSDYWPQRRVMERASIIGVRPTA